MAPAPLAGQEQPARLTRHPPDRPLQRRLATELFCRGEPEQAPPFRLLRAAPQVIQACRRLRRSLAVFLEGNSRRWI